MQPLTAGSGQKGVKRKKKVAKKKKKATKAARNDNDDDDDDNVTEKATKKEAPADGSVSRLREERRDLYDLLYGDEEDASRVASTFNSATSSLSSLLMNDDNLDAFDPYGLDDF